jgi:hypothetical protein
MNLSSSSYSSAISPASRMKIYKFELLSISSRDIRKANLFFS